MTNTVVGIDPGKSGWVVGLSTTTDHAFAQRLSYSKQGDLDFAPIVKRLKAAPLVILEQVQGRQGWGATQIFSFGQNYGQVRQAIAAQGWPYITVTPQSWQRVMHANTTKLKDKKAQSATAYELLFPHDPLPRNSGRVNDGLVDAWLIAVYGVITELKLPVRKWRL